MIQVIEESRSGWHVVGLSGRADALAADELEKALCGAIETHPKVAVDFAGVAYISSAGIRSVLQAARAAQTNKVEFVICSLSPPVKKVFEMSGLHNILRIHGELPC